MQIPDLIATADPDFAELALDELRQALSGGKIGQALAPGIWPVQLTDGFFALAEAWRTRRPIFVRHIAPVQNVLPITGTTADLAQLQAVVQSEFGPLFDPELPFSVQTRLLGSPDYKPFDINRALADIIQQESGAPLDVKRPFQIFSVLLTDSHAYMGISLAVHNLSDWAGGVRRFAKEPGQISRAEFKLLEALEQFQIDLPARGRALDLGAAPGGWTRVLRQQDQYVTAVDPAQLHPSLQQDKKVRHWQMHAEAYLNQEPDQVDLIVNDMRLDARDSARLMVAYEPVLYPHGILLMTLKLPTQGRVSPLDHALNILSDRYTIVGVRQLFHNRSEVTVYARKPRRDATR